MKLTDLEIAALQQARELEGFALDGNVWRPCIDAPTTVVDRNHSISKRRMTAFVKAGLADGDSWEPYREITPEGIKTLENHDDQNR